MYVYVHICLCISGHLFKRSIYYCNGWAPHNDNHSSLRTEIDAFEYRFFFTETTNLMRSNITFQFDEDFFFQTIKLYIKLQKRNIFNGK